MASCSCPDRQTMILMTPMTLDIYFYRRCSRRQWTFVTNKNLWRKTKQSSSIGLLQIFGGKKDPFYDGAPRTSIALWMDGVINTQMSPPPPLSLDLWLHCSRGLQLCQMSTFSNRKRTLLGCGNQFSSAIFCCK